YRGARDRAAGRMFNTSYGSPLLQTMLGLPPGRDGEPGLRTRDDVYETLVTQKIAGLRSRFAEGGIREAGVRILLYAGSDEQRVDTRGFKMLQRVCEEKDELFGGERLSRAERRDLFKDQFFMLLLDEEQSLAALPRLLPPQTERDAVVEVVREGLFAKGDLSPPRKDRLACY